LIRCKHTLMKKTFFLITFVLLCHLSVGADSSPDRSISLDMTNRALSEVLDRLSQITGYRFKYDREWATENISVKIVNQDLDKSLRMILGHYNYGILYGTDGDIRIMIYGEKGIISSSPINASSPVEDVHVGSAAIQEDDGATRQDIEENQTEVDFVDTSGGSQDDDLEEKEKGADDDTETEEEPMETDTGDVNDGDSEEDDQNPLTSETND